MAKKFILNNGKIYIGNVAYHKDLAKDHSTTTGGGFWEVDDHQKILYLWGASSDFGYAKPEDIKTADFNIYAHLMDGYTIKHAAVISSLIPDLDKFVDVGIVIKRSEPV